MKYYRLITFLIASIALSACGIKNRSSSNDIPSASVPTEHSAVSGAIGEAGGQVKDPENNLTITIPSGALSSDTNITATYIESPEILNSKLSADFLGAVEFGPSGTTFAKPVQVTINLNKTPKNSSLAVFCYSAQNDVWEYVTDATQNGNKATFEVMHFSTYQVMDRTRDFLNEYTNIVKHAKTNGLSDSEIIEAFRDFLVNEKHVMDQYTTYNGYWYEPCGLKINGKYQVNGNSGDAEALSHSEGESNKVGNAYGLSVIDGATSNKQDVKGASSSSEVYDVTVIVEYKIIKPDIELSASKKKLNKGESATINIRCHYTNAQNFYPEYKDLDLANYMLTIAKPTNYTTDKTAVLTNGSGRASFVVTAKENNKAETITVNFDVAGDFGTHAEGNITLNSAGISISGHIEEKISFEHTYSASNIGLVQKGTFTLIISYDLEGQLTESDGAVVGALSYKNVDANISSTPSEMYNLDRPSQHAYYNVFEEITSATPYSPSFSVVGSVGANDVCSIDTIDDANLISLAGTGMYWPDYGREHGGTFAFTINIKVGAPLLLDFALSNGEHTDVSNSFKDTVDAFTVGNGKIMEPLSNNSIPVIVSNQVEITTQTITVA